MRGAMNDLPELDDLSAEELDALRRRLPENPVERLQVYRKLLADCRDFLARHPASSAVAGQCAAAIEAIDRGIKSKLS